MVELEDFPRSERLFVGSRVGRLMPFEARVVTPKAIGVYQVLVEDGVLIEEGELWGVFEPEQIQLEKRALDSELLAYPAKLEELSLKHRDEIQKAREAVIELENGLVELEAVSGSEQLKDSEALKVDFQEAKSGLLTRLVLLRSQLRLLEEGRQYQAELQRLGLNKERQESSYRQLAQRSELRSPFKGRLQFMGELAHEGSVVLPRKVTVKDGVSPFVLFSEEERYLVKVPTLVRELDGVSLKDLELAIDRSAGEKRIEAKFLTVETDPRDPTKVVSWVFQVKAKDVQDAKERKAGAEAVADLFLVLDEPVSLIPKSKLLAGLTAEDGHIFSWKDVLAKMLPDCFLVAEGQGVLAVRKKL